MDTHVGDEEDGGGGVGAAAESNGQGRDIESPDRERRRNRCSFNDESAQSQPAGGKDRKSAIARKKSIVLKGMLLEEANKQASDSFRKARKEDEVANEKPKLVTKEAIATPWRGGAVLHPLSAIRLLWDLVFTVGSLYLTVAAPIHYTWELQRDGAGHFGTLGAVMTALFVCNVSARHPTRAPRASLLRASGAALGISL